MNLKITVASALTGVCALVFGPVALGGGFGGGAVCAPPSKAPAGSPGGAEPVPGPGMPPAAAGAGGTTAHGPAVDGFTAEQVGNAATITATGARLGVPMRGWVIAVATAIQESGLRNLPGGDRDSIGLFQQRPSQGWGTPARLHDPVYAATKFYQRLLQVPHWQQLPLTEAADAVQRSAFPTAYARHEAAATRLVTAVGSGSGGADSGAVEQCVSTGGWALPAPGPIVSGWRTPDRPTHAGVDIGAARGTAIRAAAAGVVVTVRCNVSVGTCDTDGGIAVKGCGWYVDIDHGWGVTTRYCHQLREPLVHVGQRVAVGEPIGVVGASGNASGPHLHFEVRINGKDTDPVRFLAARGVPLGR
jgi:murein DD-endopeptidase MepM/ murein hydrolase activator NlpD